MSIAQREYKKKKAQKKAQRFKQMDDERETDKNKWIQFNEKVCLLKRFKGCQRPGVDLSKLSKGKVKLSEIAKCVCLVKGGSILLKEGQTPRHNPPVPVGDYTKSIHHLTTTTSF